MGEADAVDVGHDAAGGVASPGGEGERGRSTCEASDAVMCAAFQRALDATPSQLVERCYMFAGRLVRFRIVGSHLATCVTRPFSHLEARCVEAIDPDLTVDVWDEAATAVANPGAPPLDDPSLPVAIDTTTDGRIVQFRRAAATYSFDRAAGRIVGWISDTSHLPQLERGRPFRDPLLLWHQDRGVETVHAALVAREGRGILFGGAGGSGKTTTALACLHGGFTYLSDDYVGLQLIDGQRFVGHSLFCSAHLDPHQMRRFGSLESHAEAATLPGEDKSLIVLTDVFPDRLGRRADLHVVALPRVSGTPETTFRPATKAEAVLSLAPSSLLMQPASSKRKRGFEKLVRLIQHTPTYWLEVGSDLTAIPSRVDELLREAVP